MTGYIQIEINGKPVGLKFTMWAIEEMNRLQNQRSDSVLWKSVVMVYAGYENNCRYKKEEPSISIDEVELFVDELYSTKEGEAKMTEISKALTESYMFKSLTGQLDDEDTKKKKQTGNGSTKLPSERLA